MHTPMRVHTCAYACMCIYTHAQKGKIIKFNFSIILNVQVDQNLFNFFFTESLFFVITLQTGKLFKEYTVKLFMAT